MKNFISIPKPCNENWDAMTPKEQGRHCGKCKIVVKDFTQMSNEEILQYIKTQTKPECAKVNAEQLIGSSNLTQKAKRFLYALAVCFLPFTTLTTASLFLSSESSAQSQSGSISGKIYNQKGETVPFALIVLEQDGIQKKVGKSDIKGNYKLKPLSPGTYTLKISRIGFKTLEIPDIEIKMDAFRKNFTITKDKNRKVHFVGLLIIPKIVDQYEPNKQEISGNQIKDMFGG